MNEMVISAATLGGAGANRTRPAGGGTPLGGTTINSDPSGPDGLQLTRRGRLVLLGIPAITLAAVVVFASLAVMLGSMAAPAHASSAGTAVDLADYAVSVTVLQGQSLWSIAAESDPNRDVRDVVSEIVALNELGSGVIQAGQQLFVPLRQ